MEKEGVYGYDGNLDIRPPYQREFIYNDKMRCAVIESILKDFPLNVMYWADREDGTFEIIDGQQRTISIAQYVEGYFSVSLKYFHNLSEEIQSRILDYELMVYVCTGTSDEKLDWFRTINIAGEKLTPQELRNAVYAGPWVTDAKRYFSRHMGAAHQLGSDYMKGKAIRQEYLETAIKWISGGNIEEYMAVHQHDNNAEELWAYFQDVIGWIQDTFTEPRPKMMRGIDWGFLYDDFWDVDLDPDDIEAETLELIDDDDVTNQKGIYAYILTREEKHLNIRAFSNSEKRRAYERQGGLCAIRGVKYNISQMEADHIIPVG